MTNRSYHDALAYFEAARDLTDDVRRDYLAHRTPESVVRLAEADCMLETARQQYQDVCNREWAEMLAAEAEAGTGVMVDGHVEWSSAS